MSRTAFGTSGTSLAAARRWKVWLLLLCLWCLPVHPEPPLPQFDGQQRAGVATCADSKCHDAERPWQTSKILQNEYRTWIEYSTHAESFKVLGSDLGKQIGEFLKLDPVSAPQCLDCHADNVPVAQRGKKFNLEDGVGCEACHGGAAPWLENHVSMSGSRADYLEAGLYPTEFPVPRAELCLSCHQGNDRKFVDHRLLAAGHPRLVFELDTYFVNMPLHHREDADYAFRKAPPPNAEFWVTGQIMAAKAWLRLFDDDKHRMTGVLPEPAFQDCYSCHTVVRPRHGARQGRTPLALDLAHLRMLTTIFPDPDLKAAVDALQSSVGQDLATVRRATRHLQTLLGETRFQPRRLSTAQIDPFLQRLLDAGSKQAYRTYIEAEQATMAIASLLRSLDPGGRLEGATEKLFDATNDPDAFSAPGYAAAVAQLRTARQQLRPE